MQKEINLYKIYVGLNSIERSNLSQTMNTKLREYSQLLKRLKYLVDKNQGDSEASDFVRDLLSDCWRGLSDEDCEKAQEMEENLGLSGEIT